MTVELSAAVFEGVYLLEPIVSGVECEGSVLEGVLLEAPLVEGE